MFEEKIYKERRQELKNYLKKGVYLFLGNKESPMNYPSNTYKFRQDSNFLYYFGIDEPDLAAIIDIDNDEEIIFGDDRTIDDIIWMGTQDSIKEKAEKCGVKKTAEFASLTVFIDKAAASGCVINYLPQYRAENIIFLQTLLNNPSAGQCSQDFIKAVIRQRSIKSAEEIEQIENALEISYEMNTAAMKFTRPGMRESEISGIVEGISLAKGNGVSFPVIFTVRGETLHNHYHGNIMKEGDLALLDSGAESDLHYASDITRTFPVSGKFSEKQKEIYNIVLKSQVNAISICKPGRKFREIHLETAKIIATGLKDAGIMKGSTDDAVLAGAHALFFPHGLGHMLGLDVHDMEGLGENLVGYGEEVSRSDQFGLAYLRLAKELHTGFVTTIEPGIYFIPALIEKWKSENKHTDFINYNVLEKYMDFGGIRIEDNILITGTGSRVLGRNPIPKTIEEVELCCR